MIARRNPVRAPTNASLIDRQLKVELPFISAAGTPQPYCLVIKPFAFGFGKAVATFFGDRVDVCGRFAVYVNDHLFLATHTRQRYSKAPRTTHKMNRACSKRTAAASAE